MKNHNLYNYNHGGGYTRPSNPGNGGGPTHGGGGYSNTWPVIGGGSGGPTHGGSGYSNGGSSGGGPTHG